MTALTMDGATVDAIDPEGRGLFGPPLGEPLDGPMAIARRGPCPLASHGRGIERL